MSTVAILGPKGSDSYQAATQYFQYVEPVFFNSMSELAAAYQNGQCTFALIPVYNTRIGEIKEYFRFLLSLTDCFWVNNIVLPIQLSIGGLASHKETIDTIVSRGAIFNQCKDYLKSNFPDATLITVKDIGKKLADIKDNKRTNYGVVESEDLLKHFGYNIYEREVVSHNKTRFAVIERKPAKASGYDATTIITRPLRDRVGMLVDILGEFTRRGINILDLRSENDIETQKLQIYLEIEGHYSDAIIQEALTTVEKGVIQEENAIKLLGSFPRVDMRVKRIKSFGFIGTGDMSTWFADRLNSEGYVTYLTGRSTDLKPEEMIEMVDVVVVCVPISVTSSTISQYGPLLKDGQALILLAGESENSLQTAFDSTVDGVEVMLVHNLWGPQAITMKDKNASVVRTARSGQYCSEFEAFLYKHGAEIFQDSAKKHDLLMGFGQKLPTMISVALASTLAQHNINSSDIGSHCTLTSIYGVLAMARVHNQNPRTYAEIMSTKGEGRKIVKTFIDNLTKIIELAEKEEIYKLCDLMEANKHHLSPSFLEARMKQAKSVDDILNESGINYHF